MELTKFKINLLPLDFERATLTFRKKSSSKASRIAKDGSSSSALSTSQFKVMLGKRTPKGYEKSPASPSQISSPYSHTTTSPDRSNPTGHSWDWDKPFTLNSLPFSKIGVVKPLKEEGSLDDTIDSKSEEWGVEAFTAGFGLRNPLRRKPFFEVHGLKLSFTESTFTGCTAAASSAVKN
jgi:hypothetical protein